MVGLHGNTFKPHTGTKTSVLFIQKWNDDPNAGSLCPRQDNYNIFFATMQKSGKDNSGEKIYVKELDNSGKFLLDDNKHLIVDHDLYNHEGLTEDGIAEAFIEFAKKEGLSFFKLGPSVTPFDAVRYQQLMDGLEVSSVNLSVVLFDNESFRFDSEYFQKANLYLDNLLGKFETVSISEISKVADGDHSKFPENQKQQVKYLQAKDIKNYFLENDNPVYVSKSYFLQNPRSHIEGENILLSIMGTVGDITITPKAFEHCLCNRALAIIKKIKNIDPYFLFAYLTTNQATLLINRLKNGGVQERINLDVLGRVKVPLMNKTFQKLIRNIVIFGYQTREISKLIYQQAEDLLLSELGLKDWQPSKETIAVKSFRDSFLSFGRLDSEYYQPKYDKFYESLETAGSEKSWRLKKLKSLSSLFKYGTSEPFEYLEQGVPFLRIADLHKYRFSKTDLKFISQEAASQQQANVRTGDVLISRSGTLGLTVVISEYLNNAVYGSYFILTRPHQEAILPTYLSLYLNSLVGKLQTEQANTGGIQTNLTIPVLESLLIACPPLKTQQKFVDKVNQSYDAEDKSKQLLEIAKIGVERAIETNEVTATTWINGQLEKLEVKL